MNPMTLRRWLGVSAIVVTAGTATGIGISTINGPNPTPPATVAQWMRNGGSRLIQTLRDDFTALNGPDRAFDLPKMAAGCDHLLADVRKAQAYAPVPDTTTETRWSTALALYATGAADCAHGSDTQNYSLIITSAAELAQGTGNVVALTPRLDELSRH
jgi:hypothetical protein